MLNKKQYISQLKQLVEIPSINGNQSQNSKALELVLEWVSKKAVIKKYTNNGAEILLLSNASSQKDPSFLNPEFGYVVHIDVVSAPIELFSMQTVEQKKTRTNQLATIVKGRGVDDMKFSIPMGISILNMLLESNSKKTLTIAITTDEESGGFNGGKYLAKDIKFRPKVLLVPDGGDNWTLINKSKGFFLLTLECFGTSAHGSRPWRGKNANTTLIKTLSKLLNRFDATSYKKSWDITLNIGVISGGESSNQICDYSKALLDFRIPETVDQLKLLSEIKEIVSLVDSTSKITINHDGDAVFTDENSKVVQEFITTMQKHTSEKITVEETYGGSDARFFAEYNIPILMMRPNGGGQHESTEWISIESCLEYMSGLSEFITTYTP